MSSRPPAFYAYLLIAVGLVILAFSMWAMVQALADYEAGRFPEFFVYGITASVGTVLAVSSITKMRRQMVALHNLAVKVLSAVVCANCGFKVVRTFSTGDYVMKGVGQCQQCKGNMRVDAIYSEETKPKKA